MIVKAVKFNFVVLNSSFFFHFPPPFLSFLSFLSPITVILSTTELPANMENSSIGVRPTLPPRPSLMLRKEKERGASVPPRSNRERPQKEVRVTKASSSRKERLEKERPEKNEEKVEQELKVKSTVVDIDSVREEEVKEENLGLLEAAEEDGE